jgi:uncharacterized SAM-binding protein YcdF (DUF218 family)
MKSCYFGIVVIGLLTIVLCLIHRPILLAIGGVLVVQDELHPADVIHVISGPSYRVDYAVRLYQEGYGKQLFLTGSGHQAFTHKLRAMRRGVPNEAVVADASRVSSTYSEAVRLQAFIDRSKEPIDSVIVSSDAYHMRRARWAYRKVLGDQVEVQMAPVPFEASPFRREWWTHGRSGVHVLEEYVKMVYYWARYQFFRGRIQEWLASLDRY